jgi:hypothetical protein
MLQDIVLSEHEKEFFRYLFFTFKNPSSEYIEGGEVAGLFQKAQLEKVILVLNIVSIEGDLGLFEHAKIKKFKY